MTQPVAQPLPTDWLDHRIGPYRIRALIGCGGAGEVYEAVRHDPPVPVRVALAAGAEELETDVVAGDAREDVAQQPIEAETIRPPVEIGEEPEPQRRRTPSCCSRWSWPPPDRSPASPWPPCRVC